VRTGDGDYFPAFIGSHPPDGWKRFHPEKEPVELLLLFHTGDAFFRKSIRGKKTGQYLKFQADFYSAAPGGFL
jgi:hypothetical protein